MSDILTALRRHRRLLVMSFDAGAWILSFVLTGVLRYGELDGATLPPILWTGLTAATLHLLVARMLLLHQGRARVASLEEMVLLGASAALTGTLLFLVNLTPIWVPRSVPLGAAVCFLVLAGWGRAMMRQLREREFDALGTRDGHRVLLVGAGDAARDLVNSMLRDPQRTWRPVGMLDDDPLKRRLRIRNVPVLGPTSTLARSITTCGVSTVVIAIPSADAQTVTRLSRQALKAGADVKVLPATSQLLSDHVGIRDIRDIDLTDVLGRNQLDTDVTAIAGYLTGRRVLVTGAGGSIGAELCRQIHGYAPAELMLLDRDESALHAVQLTLHGRALLDSQDVILCDIRDQEALDRVFAARRPEVVFHAAALKHLPMLEQYPAEAVKTNVLGTVKVLKAARAVGVERFVNISTDKAANPTSVLGYSKRVAEMITAEQAAVAPDATYLSVRFGNVLGSRGSVLTVFAAQIAAGGPLTVTDPQVTRYFMTIEEACQLVVQAGAIGEAGEALVLDMGRPVRILDVAEQLIEQSGRPIEIEFTGLRPGEKLHEELFGENEPHHVRPRHPLVSHVPVPRLTDTRIDALPTQGAPDEVAAQLAAVCRVTPAPAPGPWPRETLG